MLKRYKLRCKIKKLKENRAMLIRKVDKKEISQEMKITDNIDIELKIYA